MIHVEGSERLVAICFSVLNNSLFLIISCANRWFPIALLMHCSLPARFSPRLLLVAMISYRDGCRRHLRITAHAQFPFLLYVSFLMCSIQKLGQTWGRGMPVENLYVEWFLAQFVPARLFGGCGVDVDANAC